VVSNSLNTEYYFNIPQTRKVIKYALSMKMYNDIGAPCIASGIAAEERHMYVILVLQAAGR
jgi:hypothetical protein